MRHCQRERTILSRRRLYTFAMVESSLQMPGVENSYIQSLYTRLMPKKMQRRLFLLTLYRIVYFDHAIHLWHHFSVYNLIPEITVLTAKEKSRYILSQIDNYNLQSRYSPSIRICLSSSFTHSSKLLLINLGTFQIDRNVCQLLWTKC